MPNAKRPNIIFLMTDQHRWDALGCANPTVRTPHLDALAAQGIRYSQAVCNVPCCIPSRYSMMTGLYGSQCGIRANAQMIATDQELPLPVIPQRLHRLGYQTAGFGKTHWYAEIPGARGPRPSRRGFEVRTHTESQHTVHAEPGMLHQDQDDPEGFARFRREIAPYGYGGENAAGYIGRTSAVPESEHREGWGTAQALRFLDEQRDPARPLFLYLSFDQPHAGFNVPAGYEDLYRLDDIPDRPLPPWEEGASGRCIPHEHAPLPTSGRMDLREHWTNMDPRERRRTTLRYYAMCSYVDDMFGRVLGRLQDAGELDDAFIIFCSDHGEMLGDRLHLFSKYCLYEGSVRVPLIVAGAGVPDDRRGSVDDRYAELIDVLPTLLQVTGEPPNRSLPGRSLLEAPCRRGGFAEYHGVGGETVQSAPAYMWRTRRWKLILYFAEDLSQAMNHTDQVRGELYDLEHDPHEWHNLFADERYAERREALTRELLMHLACAWARYPRHTAKAGLGA